MFDGLRKLRAPVHLDIEVRFETPPGVQAQVDFARFVVDFTDDPGTSRVVWLFSLVLGHSRFLFARYVLHQDLRMRSSNCFFVLHPFVRPEPRPSLRPDLAPAGARLAGAVEDAACGTGEAGAQRPRRRRAQRYAPQPGTPFTHPGPAAQLGLSMLRLA
jgi:hypothetical protein